MIDTLHDIQNGLAVGCLSALVAFVVALAIFLVCRSARTAMRSARISRLGSVLAAAFVGALAYYGGSKSIGSISYPRTNAEMALLANDGTSYVSNDVVRVGYLRHRILPDSADLNVWRRENGSTNDDAWVAQYVSTVGESPSPVLIDFQAATNFDWIVFTTWQPGPSVQTNGVLHSAWRGVPGPLNVRIFGVPIRTNVIEDGKLIAPPKKQTKGDNQ